MDDNEETPAAPETLDALLGKVEKRDDARGMIDIKSARKNGA